MKISLVFFISGHTFLGVMFSNFHIQVSFFTLNLIDCCLCLINFIFHILSFFYIL